MSSPHRTAFVGAGLPAMASPRIARQTASLASQASQLPQVLCCFTQSLFTEPLWERACPRWHPRGLPGRPRRLHRRQASSHRFCVVSHSRCSQNPCGSEPAREGIPEDCQADRVACIAGQLPQVLCCFTQLVCSQNHCGSGLARDGIPEDCQADRVACIAGKPHRFCVVHTVGVHRTLVGASLLAMASTTTATGFLGAGEPGFFAGYPPACAWSGLFRH